MKNKTWLLVAVILVAVMVSAAVLYPMLSERYSPSTPTPPASTDIPEPDTEVTEPNTEVTEPDTEVNEPDTEVTEPDTEDAVIRADDFTFCDSEMNKVKLSDFFGKPIIVNFWASWCGPCVSELPEFDAMYAKYKDDVVFLMVNLAGGASENVDDVKAFAAENGYTFPLYFDIDSDGANTYGIWSIPQTLVIRADGSLLDTRIGAMSGETLENYIRQITEKGAN